MQLTEQRPGLWGCIGFSRNRGHVTVQVFPSWGTGQASHNHLLHNRWSAVSRKPPFFLWNWDTFSRNSTAAFFTEHTVWAPKTRPTTASIILKKKPWLQVQVRNLHSAQDCLGLGTSSGWADVSRAGHESCRCWSGMATERGEIQLWGSHNQDCVGNLPQGSWLSKSREGTGFP